MRGLSAQAPSARRKRQACQGQVTMPSLDVAAAQRRAHVRADVVDGVILAARCRRRRSACSPTSPSCPRPRPRRRPGTPSGTRPCRPSSTNLPGSLMRFVVMILPGLRPLCTPCTGRRQIMLEDRTEIRRRRLRRPRSDALPSGEPRRGEALREADHYFNAPDRDFARTDEAFRLRRIGAANFVTYKGPKRDAQRKMRTEIEVPLPDGDEAAAGLHPRCCSTSATAPSPWSASSGGFTTWSATASRWKRLPRRGRRPGPLRRGGDSGAGGAAGRGP